MSKKHRGLAGISRLVRERESAVKRALLETAECDRREAERLVSATHRLKDPDYSVRDWLMDIGTQSYSAGVVMLLLSAEARQAIYGDTQSKKAKLPRTDEVLRDAIQSLAAREGTAKALWSELFSMLDSEGRSPVEDDENANMRKWRITYEADDGSHPHITFGNFQTKLTKAQKDQKS